MRCHVTGLKATPTSLVTREKPERQRVNIECHASHDAHLRLSVMRGSRWIAENIAIAVQGGRNALSVLLPAAEREEPARFIFKDMDGQMIIEAECLWPPPREWTLYVIRSSHIDMGLHNSHYIQRHNCSAFLDEAMKLCDATESWNDPERYRYVVEGTWWWRNFCDDRGDDAAKRLINNYAANGKIGIGAATAGNHTQVYGHEQMCRSAYTRNKLRQDWGVDSRTMIMADNNGMSWALVAPYRDAGFENIIFAPNQWNPLPSTIWPHDERVAGRIWNPEASGGGSRIDVRYDSAIPMVFYWQGADGKSKLLVWASTCYSWGGSPFGFHSSMGHDTPDLKKMERCTVTQLTKMERDYPYDVWMFACYDDDEEPQLSVNHAIREWNRKWKWPQFRSVGNLDEPFDRLRKKFDADIPVLRGDITGGWYQHPLATPELLARKFAVDRLLPTAEKLATLAGLFAAGYEYPATEFNRAWDALLYNDEHSYGTSGYQGRKVYETWMQHRDWIDKAETIAERETDRALEAFSKRITVDEPSLVLFNPTLQTRRELIVAKNGNGQDIKFISPEIPSFGYIAVPLASLPEAVMPSSRYADGAPTIENFFYRVAFSEDGSIASIFDKELKRELLDRTGAFKCNQFVYTRDNHGSFVTPGNARFEIIRDDFETAVISTMQEPVSGAAVQQRVSLPMHEKRIDIDNRLRHVKDLINENRYYRYGYYAFPFAVGNAVPRVQMNGCIATPGKDQTGHGTETYMAAREWCCVENDSFGVALLQQDSHLVEFGMIHPDKTDCYLGKQGSAVYSYLFNDWLQMHTPGGSHVNPRFRYTIVSYAGNFRQAGIPRLAQRAGSPILLHTIPAQKGTLPQTGMSFMSSPQAEFELLTLKRAEDGNGIIARLHECHGIDASEAAIRQTLAVDAMATLCSIDERVKSEQFTDDNFQVSRNGYLTVRFNTGRLSQRSLEQIHSENDCPAPIGSAYTGLITKPRAACGEHQGHLYLLWGQNMEPDLSHYELYRSERSGFIPDQDTLLARVEPGPYRVALHEERDLRTHTDYYYRVRAINRTGKCGDFSDEFHGLTRE